MYIKCKISITYIKNLYKKILKTIWKTLSVKMEQEQTIVKLVKIGNSKHIVGSDSYKKCRNSNNGHVKKSRQKEKEKKLKNQELLEELNKKNAFLNQDLTNKFNEMEKLKNEIDPSKIPKELLERIVSTESTFEFLISNQIIN